MYLQTLFAATGTVSMDTVLQICITAVLALVSIFLARLFFVINRMESQIRETEKALYELKIHLPSAYVQSASMDSFRAQITSQIENLDANMRQQFQALHAELKEKADK